MISNLKMTKPGKLGNPIEKATGDPFGAELTFYHEGAALTIDCFWCAHLGETYIWAMHKGLLIPKHATKTKIGVNAVGYWNSMSIKVGSSISGQAALCPEGTINTNAELATAYWDISRLNMPGITPKMDSHLADIKAILERTYSDVYKVKAPPFAGVTLSDLNATPNGGS